MSTDEIRSIDYSKYKLEFDLVHITYPDWGGKNIDDNLTENQRRMLLGNWLSLIRTCRKQKIPVIVNLSRSIGNRPYYDETRKVGTNPFEDFDVHNYLKYYDSVIKIKEDELFKNLKRLSKPKVLMGGLHLYVDNYKHDKEIYACVGSDISRIRDVLKNPRIIVDPNISVYSSMPKLYDVLYLIESRGGRRFCRQVPYESVYKNNDF